MRPKIVFPILILALLVMLSLLFVRHMGTPPGNPPGQAGDKNTADAATSAPLISPPLDSETSSNSPAATSPAAESDSPSAASKATHEAYVAERVAELGDLAMENDAASLDTILSELTNRDPEIRKAALEAAVQFGSRDAIPKLADVAVQT